MCCTLSSHASLQFSIIDVRPLHGMNDLCARYGFKVLAHGTLVSTSLRVRVDSDHDIVTDAVRRISHRPVARETGARAVFGPIESFSEKGNARSILEVILWLLTLTVTRHMRQYLDVILKAWGDWDLFQTLLRLLRDIADRHGGVSIANVAIRWVLEHPFVGAVLIGMVQLFAFSRRVICRR